MAIKGASYFQKHGLANKLQGRSLLIAVNLVAGLSIFFFGYDQGKLSRCFVSDLWLTDRLRCDGRSQRESELCQNNGFWILERTASQGDEGAAAGGYRRSMRGTDSNTNF